MPKQPCRSCGGPSKSWEWSARCYLPTVRVSRGHFGAKIYWPIYEEAEKLDCPLAVHVGSLHHLGMDTLGVYYAVHALGHPFGIMAQAAAMLSYGVFDRFPKLRVG